MKSPLRLVRSVFPSVTLVAALSVGSVNVHAWSLAPQPVEGVLLLKNSNILRGKIQKVGQHYHVHLPNGKLQVREQQVETVCQHVEAAYQYRRQRRGGSSADSHLKLASWCLRHDLFDHADEELQQAESIDADHPRLPMLRRQASQSRKLAEQATRRAASPPKSAELRPVEPDEIEKAPKWARALFVRQIQPLIVQSCATSGCHQAGSESAFQLNRLALDGPGHPGVTLRNLAETLKQVDFEDANASQLLAKARQAHGAEPAATTALAPQKLRVLNSWVEQLAEAHQQFDAIHTVPALAEVASKPLTPSLQLNPPAQTARQPREPVRVASFASADPFDPSAFNKKFATVAAPSTPAPVTAEQQLSVPHVLAPSDPQPIPLPQVQ
ncbi:MAG: hypothetical protein AAGD11_03235 [Planctomycetota bacterium]